MLNLPACPPSLKSIAHYLKTAQEHSTRDIVVTYWSCLYTLQTGLKISSKKPEETSLLIAIMEWLEKTKLENSTNEAITNEVVAQAYLENYALKLLTYANQQDEASNFGKNVVKAFYTAGMIYDVLLVFGEQSEEAQNNGKYSKWKATYIHNCLKNGETPVPGNHFTNETEDEDHELENVTNEHADGDALSSNKQQSEISPAPSDETPNAIDNPKIPTSSSAIGFQPYVPHSENIPTSIPTADAQIPVASGPLPSLTPEQISKAQKYCKWAGSALNFDDTKAAIENLQKGLRLLQTGQDE